MSNPEPDLSFNHAWAKVKWAEYHIRNLSGVCDTIVKDHPCTVTSETDPETGDWMLVVQPSEPLSPVVSLLAGDAIHNMRAALDYCWMGLWRSVHPNPPKATLPRGISRQEVVGTLKKTAMEQSIPGVDAFVLDTLRSYKGGNDLLWLAGQLDNWNKHNLLIATLGVTKIIELTCSSNTGRIKNVIFDGTEVIASKPVSPIRIQLSPGEFMQFDRGPVVAVDVFISFREAIEEGPLVPFLGAMLQETAEAVRLFQTTFGIDPVEKTALASASENTNPSA
ncbi:hypothetical protein [Parvibaculum sp.]|uniref:hypothetical protein n=1 Tax=Parvibaculum sp. TaxID=2024848 RepID=UPI00349FFEFC